MRASFWSDRAWKTLVGRPWPWVAPDDGPEFVTRVRATLGSYWSERRLERVPGEFLTEPTRALLADAADDIDAEHPFGAGYEKVAAAAGGRPEAFWFFDLGSAAWILMLRRLRQRGWLPDGADLSRLVEIEGIWRNGPGDAASEIEARLENARGPTPGLQLYRVPLLLWSDRQPDRAMIALDRSASDLGPHAQAEMGPTLPLTYALLHALSGHVERAAEMLAEGHVSGRPSSWVGFRTPEVRYHRARYLWDLREHDRAADIVTELVRDAPSYLLRLLTDPAWQPDHQQDAFGDLVGAVADCVDDARGDLTRWQQARPDAEDDAPGARQIEEILEVGSGEPYPVLAAASLLPEIERWRREQKAVGEEFRARLDRLRNFARQMPTGFPFRVGEGFAESFVGREASDMAQIDRWLREDRVATAARYVEDLVAELPYALKMATVTYAQRMVNTLASSAEVFAGRAEEGDENRVRRTYRLAQEVLKLREPVRDLPGRVNPELGHQFNRIWDRIRQIEDAWITLERKAFGKLRLQIPNETEPIERGRWRAFPLRVLNAAGEPVGGVPVLWRIGSGTGQPRQPSEFLTLEWALSLQTGIVRLPVAARGEGERGEIEARLLGEEDVVRLPYRIVEPGQGNAERS